MELKIALYILFAPVWIVWKIVAFIVPQIYFAIDDWWSSRKANAIVAEMEQEKKDKAAAMPCWQCHKPVGYDTWTDSAEPFKIFCSGTCWLEYHNSKTAAVEEKLSRLPTVTATSDAVLLQGKTSDGMYFEPGRCVKCGRALQDAGAVFSFCSTDCETKSLLPHRPKREPLANYGPYRTAKISEHALYNFPDHHEVEALNRQYGTSSESETKAAVKEAIEFAESNYKRLLEQDYAEARSAFLTRWQRQRDFVLSRERPKEDERLRKEAEKEDQERAKQIDKAAEEARWKPKPFEL